MGFNIKNNYGPNIEVNDGGHVTLVQGKDGMWQSIDALDAEYEEVTEDGASEAAAACPAELDTLPARALWQKAQEAGWVDEQLQPLLSRPLAALLADRMAEVLSIPAKWKVFEQLWHRRHMRNDYNAAIEQQQCDEYRKKFKRVIC